MQAKITKRAVDAVRPGDRDSFIWDTETKGFGLKVTPTGSRIYVLQARLSGELRRYTIGKHGSSWMPDKARTEALRLRGQIANGIDPAEAKNEAKRGLRIAELCDLYLVEGCDKKKA
jgi:hypothetical protein